MTDPIRILLVDDSPYFLDAARDFLHMHEAIQLVETAADGEQALAKALALSPDVILLDLNLADHSGLDLIPAFRVQLPNVKIIMLTMMEQSAYRTAALRAGADAYVQKSDMSATLIPAIRGLMQVPDTALFGGRERAQILQESETQFRTLFENAPIGIGVADMQGNLLVFNDAILQTGGYSRADIEKIGNIAALYYDAQQRDEALGLFAKRGLLKDYEVQFKRKDGTPYDALLSLSPTTFNGQPGMQAIVQDITERKRAEADLRASEEKLRGFLESAPDAIVIADGDGNIVMANRQVERLFGYTNEELVGQTVEILLQKDLRANHIAHRMEFMANPRVRAMGEHGEVYGLRKDGTRFPAEISLNYQEVDGRVSALAAIRDITERKQAEEDLRAAEIRYRTLVEHIPAITYLAACDSNKTRLYVSPQIESLLGYAQTEYLTNSDLWKKMIHPDDQERVRAEAKRFYESGEPFVCEYRSVARDGRSLWFHDEAVIVKDEAGVNQFIQGVKFEITERKQAEAKLAASEAELRVLFVAERDQRALAEALRATAETLNRTLNYGEVLDSILANVGSVVPHDAASILLIDEGRVRVARTRGHTERGLDIEKVINELSLSETNNLHTMMTTGQPVVVPDTQSDPSWVPMPGAEFLRSNVGAPISIDNQVVGFLFLDSVTPGFFTPIHAERLMAFANQAALAIHKARLYRQAQQEIAERGQVEEALRASETRFRALIENSADLIVVIGAEGVIRFVSPSAERILGYAHEEAIGRNFLEWVHPDDLPIAMEALKSRREIPGTTQTAIELRGLHKNGAWRTLEILGTNLLAEAYVKGIVLNIRDVSERKQAEDALRRAEQDYRNLFENSVNGIFKSTPAGRFVMVNPALAQIWGYDSPEDLLANVTETARQVYTDPDVRAEHTRLLQEQGGSVSGFEYQAYRKDGSTVWVSENVRSVVDADGALLYYEGAVEDISGRKLNEQILQQHLTELELLYESGLALSRLTTPKTIAEKIINLLDSKMDWYHTAIRLYNSQQGLFELLAFNQPGLQTEREKLEVAEHFSQAVARTGQGLNGWAVEHRQIVRVGDLSNDSRYVDTFPGLHSGLYVPLMVGERAIGVISIESEKADAFTAADELLTATLAVQTAAALENARLFEETRQRAEEFGALYKTSAALSAQHDDLDTLLETVVQRAVALIGAVGGGMYLYDAATEELELVVATDLLVTIGDRLRLGEGLAGRVAQTRQPQRVDDYSIWEGRAQKYEGMPIRAVLDVPMLYGGELLGVLVVQEIGDSERKFNEADKRLLSLFAAQTAGAIRTARLLNETERRAEEFESLYETTRDLSTLQDLSSILRIVTQRAALLLGVPNASLNLYDEAHKELVLAASIGPDLPIGSRRPLGSGLAGHVAQSGAPMIVEDYQVWENRSPLFEGIPLKAIMGVPLMYGNKVLGVLDVCELAPSKRTFGEADARLLTLFAGQAASAIANTRLYEETLRNLKNLTALRTIDEAIAGSMDMSAVLKVILEQGIPQLGVDAACVLLFDPQEQALKYVSGQGFHTEALKFTRLSLGDGYAGRAAAGRQMEYIADVRGRNTDFLRSPKFSEEGFVSYFAVPLIAKGEVKGVLELFQRSSLNPPAEWFEFLDVLSKQSAIAIDNATLYKNLQISNIELSMAYDATIEGWSHALDLRDKETEGHTLRVTEMALQLARHMNISEKELVHIRRGALLHDIGKMGVPDQILLKPGHRNERRETQDITHDRCSRRAAG